MVIRPALFKLEGLLILAIGALLALSAIGKRTNEARARAWLAANLSVFEEQFAHVGTPDKQLLQSSADSYYAYATGRRGVRDGVRAAIELKPRGDFFRTAFDFLYALYDVMAPAPKDQVVLEAGLGGAGAGVEFVFAVSEKGAIRATRDLRWDLRAFAPVADSGLLPGSNHCVHTEIGQVTETLLAPHAQGGLGLTDFLASSEPAVRLLQSVVVSDLAAHKVQPQNECVSVTELPCAAGVS